jgi:tetratricopeptide (TPR) repeat protein
MKVARFSAMLLAVAAMFLLTATARAQVRAWEGKIEIPTYQLGEEDPNPPFPLVNRHRIYPYTMLDDLTDRKEPQSYRAVYLENEYLKATVIPDMGGRLYSLYDKVNRREVFYRNHVVKYGLVGLRGAWISGGIEWNFPDGHSVVTVSPVASTVLRDGAQSVTVVVGDIDKVSGMHWEVALTLRRGEARLEQHVTLYNCSPLPHLYWYWANAAVPATVDMQFIYPMREVVPHMKGVVWSYPIHDGVDLSWYKNTREAASLFARQVHRNFFGAYYHGSDYGVVHVADFRQVPGKKTWTWGVAGDGLIWTGLLTDHDGAYNEIQAGRYETQLNYEFIPPDHVESFTEYWYPVHGLGGGFVEATKALAMNVRFVPSSNVHRAQVEVSVSPTLAIAAPKIRVLAGSRLLREFGAAALAPLKTVHFAADVESLDEARNNLIVEVHAADGSSLAHWSAAAPIDGNPDFVPAAGKKPPPPKPPDQMTVEELYLLGVDVEKDGREEAAAKIYQQVLERDPKYIPALLKLAWRSHQAGNFAAAEGLIARALARDSSDPRIHYVAGVVYRAAHRWTLAQDALWAAIHYGGPPAPAFVALGEIALQQREYAEAARLFHQSLSFNPGDARVQADLAVALRLGGRTGEARATIDTALTKMPLLSFARAEKWRLSATDAARAANRQAWKNIFSYDVEKYLDVAAWYRGLGDLESSDAVLAAAREDFPTQASSPLVYYYLASNARLEGNASAAQQYASQAASAPYAKVFPHRIMDALVLDEATKANALDAHAYYYLANFLFARGRYDDASRLWLQALGEGFEYAVLYRNLGVYAWRAKKDLEGAAGFYEKAVQLTPDEYRLYVDLDEIYAQLDDTARRDKLFAQAPASVLGRDTVRVRRVLLAVQQKQFEQALGVLEGHHFKPWEAGEIVRQVYVACNLEQGRAALAAGKFDDAEVAFRRATEYPENLGVGKPNEPHDEAAFFWLGEALQAAGNSDAARAAWERAGALSKRMPAVSRAFRAMALQRLGRAVEADKILDQLTQAAGKEQPTAHGLYVAGLAESFRGRKEAAQADFRAALDLDPEYWPARIELGRQK